MRGKLDGIGRVPFNKVFYFVKCYICGLFHGVKVVEATAELFTLYTASRVIRPVRRSKENLSPTSLIPCEYCRGYF